jgi:hypothetical protein
MTQVKVRLIAISVDGMDRSADASTATIESAEADAGFQSFAAARAGGVRDYSVNMTIAEDHAAGSLWRVMYDSPGTEVEFLYTPYFGSTIAEDTPVYSATAIVMEPDGSIMGGEANAAPGATATVDVSWPLTGKPVPDTLP